MPEVTRGGLAEVEARAVVYGWANRVIRTGEAIVLLHERGYDAEVPPLVRSMLEHAISLWWLKAMPGDAFQALFRRRQVELKRLKAAQQNGWEISTEAGRLIQQALEIETDPESRIVDRLPSLSRQRIRPWLHTTLSLPASQ